MVLEVIRTADGSDTLFQRDLNQHYHSTFGAIQESRHIFIENGFKHAIKEMHPGTGNMAEILSILEIGFGTGLNALLTQAGAEKHGVRVHYTALELFPLKKTYWEALNYPYLAGECDYSQVFPKLHSAKWDKPQEISPHFMLHKVHDTLEAFLPAAGTFDLVYFDAFGPDAQPELWTADIFRTLCKGMSARGILVTYSVKGTVVRALRSAGFRAEKLAGPPGKRHILRAVKL